MPDLQQKIEYFLFYQAASSAHIGLGSLRWIACGKMVPRPWWRAACGAEVHWDQPCSVAPPARYRQPELIGSVWPKRLIHEGGVAGLNSALPCSVRPICPARPLDKQAVEDMVMKSWKICLIGIQLLLAGCASNGGTTPPPTGDDGSNAGGKSSGGGMGGGGGSYFTNPSEAP